MNDRLRRFIPVAILLFALLTVHPSEPQASCAAVVPFGHLFGSWFACADDRPVAAYAWQISDPDGVNSDRVDIACEAESIGSGCLSGGVQGDGAVTIEQNWANAGFVGCPVNAGPIGTGDHLPRRIAVVTLPAWRELSGSSVITSVSGASPDLGYMVELAHPVDLAAGMIDPLACRESILALSSNLGFAVVLLQPPVIHTDCDPGSFGAALPQLGIAPTCIDAYQPVLAQGPVHTRRQACGDPIDPRRQAWTDTGVLPDAQGLATVPLPVPAIGECVFVGGSVIIDGLLAPVVTGWVHVDVDCVDADGDGYSFCYGDCDDENPDIHPGATEICNGIDDDCDGIVDGIGDPPLDTDADGVYDLCDNCPTVPNPDQDPEVCSCEVRSITIDFSSPLGRGSGVVSWTTCAEFDIAGFNVVVYSPQGERVQQNATLIPCLECITAQAAYYSFIIPKHKSGRNIFVEVVLRDGSVRSFGPATRN